MSDSDGESYDQFFNLLIEVVLNSTVTLVQDATFDQCRVIEGARLYMHKDDLGSKSKLGRWLVCMYEFLFNVVNLLTILVSVM